MTVRAEHGLLDVLHLAAEGLDQQTVFFGRAVVDSIRKIDGRGAFIDDRFGHLRKKIDFRTAGIFGRELHVIAKRPCVTDTFSRRGQRLFSSLVEFVFEMDVTGGEEDMDASLVGSFEGLGAAVDVFLYASCQARDYRRTYLRRYAAYGFEIAFRCDGKAGLENIDIELFELTRHAQLLVDEIGRASCRKECRSRWSSYLEKKK